MDLSRAIESLRSDFESADAFVCELYTKYFGEYFSEMEHLYERFKSDLVPITDDELEWIITALPLELYGASSALSQFQSYNEIVRLNIKQSKSNKSVDDANGEPIPDVQEYQVMSVVYSAVIGRVEHQISFSKELIMGAKKVWDARRKTEQNPIKETTSTLPDYDQSGSGHTYIK